MNVIYGYKCDKCDKGFNSKQSLAYHTNNNVCLKKEYCCKYCPNKFTTKNAMYAHMRDSCRVKKQNDNEKEHILDRLMKLEEDNKRLIILEENEKQQKVVIQKLEEENEKMKTQMKRVLKTTTKKIPNINNGTINNKINNNINNGTVNNNIILVGYGNEDLSKLSKTEILKILQTGYNSTVKLTEAVHFNPNFPEYHNIYISNMKDKYAMMHDGNQWTLTTKEDLINQIYEDKKNYIEENLEVFVQGLPLSRKKALERWLDTDDEDEKVKNIKENIKLLLYNSKNVVLNIKNTNTNTRKSKSIKTTKDV
jgi:hypothetical protein